MSNVPDHLGGPLPRAEYSGKLRLGEGEFDCWVLSDRRHVMSYRQTVKALTGNDGGNLVETLGRKWIKPFVSNGLEPVGIKFYVRDNVVAHGIDSDVFVGICAAFVKALGAGKLTAPRQIEIAAQCAIILGGCARVGLAALIDEATGYQNVRAADALQVKLAAFLQDELRPWGKLFPDDFWRELARLSRWKGDLHSRPKWWGIVVRDVIYDALDPDVYAHIMATKPPSAHGARWHQWFTEDFGAKRLVAHLDQVTAIARGCSAMREFRERVHLAFRRGPGQRPLPLH